MRFQTCPRLKKYADFGGELIVDAFKVFVIGAGDLFARSLQLFLPEASVQSVSREEANLVVSVSYAYSPQNEYSYLRITSMGIEIHCRDNQGARNAAAILAQIVRRRANEGYVFPCGIVEDWPDAQYRAMMLESSGRAWIPMARMRQYIKEMALCRMNVLQFHFMENVGCTIHLDCMPELPGYGEQNWKYSQDEIRDMIAFAEGLGITITPFVEVLSHATDLAKYADVACPGDTEANMFAVCLGQEKTYTVIRNVLAEIAALFPDDVIHIGADEYDMSAVSPFTAYWDKCPHCKKLAAKKGYTTLREMFLYGIGRLNRIVNDLGKVMMMWNADMHPGHLPEDLERNILMHYYRHCNDLGREKIYGLTINGYVEEGFSVINSYYPQTYMDFDYYMSAEKLNSWTYLADPLVKKANHAKVPGGCCCAWEHHNHYVRTIPAAILLFSDRLWNAGNDPAEYDDAYGRTMTRLLFNGRLPEDMNVFACIGEVLPPLNDGQLVFAHSISASEEELIRTKEALIRDGSELALFYAEAVTIAIEKKAHISEESEPLRESIFFKG